METMTVNNDRYRLGYHVMTQMDFRISKVTTISSINITLMDQIGVQCTGDMLEVKI